jgi:bacteriocin-like protein
LKFKTVVDKMKKLSISEMKKIEGGKYQLGCQAQNPGSYDNPVVGLNYSQASTFGQGHWCCSSCCTATWADHTGC